jgi:hypothetical protein
MPSGWVLAYPLTRKYSNLFEAVRIRIRFKQPDPYQIEKQDPDPYKSEKQDLDPPYQNGRDPQHCSPHVKRYFILTFMASLNFRVSTSAW